MLLTKWIRVFFSDNGTVEDLSLALNNNSTVSRSVVAAEDKLYIAQTTPFNNFFFHIVTANATSTAMTVELWDGIQWRAAVDLLDATSVSGASLGQSGVVQFSPDRDEFWDCVEDTRNEPTAFELQDDIVLYDSYFARITWSSDFTLSLQQIGYLFATDEQLVAIDPEVDNFLTSWASGKTDWLEQILLGGQHLIADLQARNLITRPGQILRFEDVSLATAYRTLVIIYNKLGPGFEFQRDWALNQYNQQLSKSRWTIDANNNAEVDRFEEDGTVIKGVR